VNRPPGQGYPYDQTHPKPAEYGGTVTTPAGRILCGYPLSEDGSVTCRNAAPCPVHRDKRVGAEDDTIELAAVEAQLNEATPEPAEPMRDPAPGLHEIVTGKPLPPYAELRAKYGSPSDLKPIPKYDPDSPLDLHDQLHADDQPWSVRSRLQTSLGRRSLATRVADALPPLLGAELADRLDTLITQALTEQEAAITQEISDRYHEARARLDADAEKKLQEVHDERYRGHSRLS
jgi:hypothetical protein